MIVEKYRPKKLEDVIGQKHVVDILNKYIEEFADEKYDFPHMLFVGKPGTGKTTIAKCLAYELFGDEWKHCFMDKNASDERGINEVRGSIKRFASSMPSKGRNIIFLDEFDNFTNDAQFALRRQMEDCSRSTIFILSVNYLNKVIEPIRSRCAIFMFSDIPKNELVKHIKYICDKESILIEDDASEKIAHYADGKVRDALNMLNMLSVYKFINIELVDKYIRNVSQDVYTDVYNKIKNNKVLQADKQIRELFKSGFNYIDVFDGFLNCIIDDEELDRTLKSDIIRKMSKFDFFVQNGANPLLQVRAFIWLLNYSFGR